MHAGKPARGWRHGQRFDRVITRAHCTYGASVSQVVRRALHVVAFVQRVLRFGCLPEQVRNHLVVLVLDGAQHRLVDLNPYKPQPLDSGTVVFACFALRSVRATVATLASAVLCCLAWPLGWSDICRTTPCR